MEFQSTRGGLEATRIGDTVYAIMPRRERVALGSAWTNKAPGDLDNSDFHASQFFDDVDQAKAELADIAVHVAEKAELARREVPSDISTIWGKSQGKTVFAEGVEFHHTASHGGCKLGRRQNAAVDARWRQAGGWYEEDVTWAIVAATFPKLFTARERRQADGTLRNWLPDEYEAINGVVLAEGESHVKDGKNFKERHRDDYVVVAASGRDDGTVLCTATLGGERQRFGGPPVEEREFIVPKGEYVPGRHGFVIDLERHPEAEVAAPGMSR